MCKFKSAIITKKGVHLTPMYNDSHSAMLKSMNIEDNSSNAMRVFVRAELVPPKGDKTADISKWEYIVDQDIIPDWYDKDPERYETEMRETVSAWMKEHFETICGKSCVKIKEDGNGTYYMLSDILFETEFGKDNNYATSKVREEILNSDFAKDLQKKYGNRLVPIKTNLLSYDGFDDYGVVEGDILALRTFDLNRECRKNIPDADNWEWLATPHSTPSSCSFDVVGYVNSCGYVDCDWCNGVSGVRPFFILKS